MKTIINVLRRLIVVIIVPIYFFIGGCFMFFGAILAMTLGIIEGFVGLILTYVLTGKIYFDIINEKTKYWKVSPDLTLPLMSCKLYGLICMFLNDIFNHFIDIMHPND